MSVFTAVRLHPEETSTNNWEATSSTTISHEEKEHKFDHVFCGQNNVDVYNTSCREVVERVAVGYNGTIAAYGQSGSGKTHSLLGNKDEEGILQLAGRHLLELIEQRVSVQYMVKLSAIEIYNETLLDLFNYDETKPCRLSDDKLYDHTEEIVESYDHFLSLCKQAHHRRKVASTELNQKSSRSHAFFLLVVESCNLDGGTGKQVTTVSQLTVIDLAGSENTRTMKNSVQTAESKKINLSLLALSRVISMLAENQKNSVIPFRDSVLTRILKKVLGGNSQFLLFCCIRKEACTETSSTISFGQKAKKMPNMAKKNEATADAALPSLLAQIGHLKRQLEEQKKETVEQDKQRLEKLLKKVFNSRGDNDFVKVEKPKRRHSIAFGGTNFKAKGMGKSFDDWKSLFRVEEENKKPCAMIMDLKSDFEHLFPVGSSNTIPIEKECLLVEKETFGDITTAFDDIKDQVKLLQKHLKNETEKALKTEENHLKALENLEQKHSKSEQESAQRIEEMEKMTKEKSRQARLYRDKYDDLKKHGLTLLREKDGKIELLKAENEKKENKYKTEMETLKKAVQKERSKRKKVEEELKKFQNVMEEKLKQQQLTIQENLHVHMVEKIELEALKRKFDEMNLASGSNGVKIKEYPTCLDPEHVFLLSKMDMLIRHRDLLVEHINSQHISGSNEE